MRRILALWLPSFATDRLRRRMGGRAPAADRPFAAVLAERGRLSLRAVDAAARAAGLAPGMALADARALEPGLAVADADPDGDAAALDRLCDWCQRYTPWASVDPAAEMGQGAGGLLLDVTGCAHLFRGEYGLLADLEGRLERAGLSARAAIAPTIGAAWAVARHGLSPVIPAGGSLDALAGLPLEALRLPPATVAALRRVGLRRVSDLYGKPRASLAARYGSVVALRLDQALGDLEEPLNPRRPVPPHLARLAFAEPVSTPEDMERAAARLLAEVCRGLVRTGEGARRLLLAAYRIDAGHEAPPQVLEVGTSRPARDPAHLLRLFREKLDRLEPGPGFELMTLTVPAADPFVAAQEDMAAETAAGSSTLPVGELVDRLGARLGLRRIVRPLPRESWIPERAVAMVPAEAPAAPPPRAWPADRGRPVRLLARPEPVDAIAPVPDDPPVMFRWRGGLYRVTQAEGPERIAPEWWCRPGDDPADADELRDYYRVQDTDGRRFWLYRLGLFAPDRQARWFLHGFLA